MAGNNLVAPAQQIAGLSLAVVRGTAGLVCQHPVLLGATLAIAQGAGAIAAPGPTLMGTTQHAPTLASQGTLVAPGPTLQGATQVRVSSGGDLRPPLSTMFGWDMLLSQGAIAAPGPTMQGSSRCFDPLAPFDPIQVKYRCGDPMGRELGIQVKSMKGPVVPVSISYCLYRVVSNGQRVQVGPPYRFPVADGARLGRYYPVGRLDGQPGTWVIRWAIQQDFYYPVQYLEQAFEVQDALMAALPGDSTVRVLKQDWS